jgi:hypothetical protein
MMKSGNAFLSLPLLLLASLATLANPAEAAAPLEFDLTYTAQLGSWRAQASRSLRKDEQTGTYHMQSHSRVMLMFKSITAIRESANFQWQGELPLALDYHFEQSGLGARERHAEFDHVAGVAHYRVNKDSGNLKLDTPTYDPLTSNLVVRQQLLAGESEIFVEVLDRNKIETWHFRVVGETMLQTELGQFAAVHVERVRQDSKRHTEFWLAKDHDYILLQLVQEEPNGRILRLDISEASLNGVAL